MADEYKTPAAAKKGQEAAMEKYDAAKTPEERAVAWLEAQKAREAKLAPKPK